MKLSTFVPLRLLAGSALLSSAALNVLRHGEARSRAHQPGGAADRQAVPGVQHLPGPLPRPQGPALPAHLLPEVSSPHSAKLAGHTLQQVGGAFHDVLPRLPACCRGILLLFTHRGGPGPPPPSSERCSLAPLSRASPRPVAVDHRITGSQDHRLADVWNDVSFPQA